MSDDNVNIIHEINRINVELKKKLEVISKWRGILSYPVNHIPTKSFQHLSSHFSVECAQMELEFLKLYTPECVEILESLKEMADTNIDSSTEPNNS